MKTVIDLSKYNPVADYTKVAKKVDGVIVRAGYRSYAKGILTEDPAYKTHIANFNKLGVPVGIYFFTTAITRTEGSQEADFAVSLLKKYGIKPSFPIFVDTEMSNKDKNGRSDKINKVQRTEAIIGFCEKIKQLGYTPGIYASDSWFVSQLDFNRIKEYKLWVASYSKAPVQVKAYAAWQYTSSFTVDGIASRVDCSHWYDEIGDTKPAVENKPTTNTKKTTEENPYKKPKGLIKYGMKGNPVRWLQFELNKYGFNLSVDGDFGPKTKVAVEYYQKKNGLKVDGIVGPKTMQKLEGVKLVSAPAKVASGPIPKVAVATPVFNPAKYVDNNTYLPKPESKTTVSNTRFEGTQFFAKGIVLYDKDDSKKIKKKISGNYYIVSNAITTDLKVQVSFTKNGSSIGWVLLSDVK